jgi:hypothetical protein
VAVEREAVAGLVTGQTPVFVTMGSLSNPVALWIAAQ